MIDNQLANFTGVSFIGTGRVSAHHLSITSLALILTAHLSPAVEILLDSNVHPLILNLQNETLLDCNVHPLILSLQNETLLDSQVHLLILNLWNETYHRDDLELTSSNKAIKTSWFLD